MLFLILFQDTDDGGRRSRRSKKTVNYAELNDIYLPPLGPQDYVGADGKIPPAGASLPGTRSRTRRNDVYIQEDYLAPRIRTTSARRRWRETEEEEEGGEELIKEERNLDENRTTSRSPETSHGGSDITEEEEEESTISETLMSIQVDGQSLKATEVLKKKTRFTCLENDDPSSTELKSFTPTAPFPQLDYVNPSFCAPPLYAPPLHASPATIHTPALPLYRNPYTSNNLPAPLMYDGALMPTKQCTSSIEQRDNYNITDSQNRPISNSPSLSSVRGENLTTEKRTVTTAVSPALFMSNIYRYTETKNLTQDQ